MGESATLQMVPPAEQIFILTDSLVGSGARFLDITDGGSGGMIYPYRR